MNSSAPYVEHLKTLGYNTVEAGFLRLVALHSGVFFRRQFMQFAGVKSGKRVDSFLKKLRSNKHCQTYSLNKNAAVYHVTSKAIYRCLEQPNLRHRRSHKIDYVKTKLLILDYVLANRTAEYMPTEEEKVHFFTKVLNVPVAHLPTKAYKTPNSKTETLRYFVDKFPLFLPDVASPEAVRFSYVDPGPHTSIIDFVNHLRLYAPLFGRLKAISLVYIYYISNKWKQAEDLFHAFIRAGCKVGAEDLDLVKYFRLREAWETRQYERVGSAELLFLNHAKKKYATSQYEALYLEWKSGDRTTSSMTSNDESRAPLATFSTYKIGENYSTFGDLD